MGRQNLMLLIAASLAGSGLQVGLDANAVDKGNDRAKLVKENLSANDRMIGANAQSMVDEGRRVSPEPLFTAVRNSRTSLNT